MTLLSDELAVWDIAFRWAGYDPDKFYFRYPIEVKDYFRLLIEAILEGEIYCGHLVLPKRPPDSKADPKYYIGTHLDDIYACIGGHFYKKKLLQWAYISRDDFKEWCERRAIPLPAFWFPKGWKYSFEWPEYGTRATWARHKEPGDNGIVSISFEIPDQYDLHDTIPEASNSVDIDMSLPANKITKLCVQQIASQIWKLFPDMTIAEISRHDVILKYSGAAHYGESAIRKWLSEVAPVNIKGKRGRPRNKSDGDTD